MQRVEQTAAAVAPVPTGRTRRDEPPPQPGSERLPIAILNVAFDPLTGSESLARIEAMIASRQPHHIVTPNVDFLAQARQDAELRRILLNADLVLCDGTPLLWAARLLGNSLPERVAGSDLAPQLIRLAAAKHHRIFFLGGLPGVAAAAVARLKAQYPGLEVAGYSPPVSALLTMDHADITRRIRAARPDVLFVCFGCPKAEKWSAMHYRSLGVPIVMGAGATIDFLAGRMKRAPRWMRRGGLEWMFRLLQEPRRLFRRYLTDFCVFFPAIGRQWWSMRTRRRWTEDVSSGKSSFEAPDCRIVRAPDCLDIHALREDPSLWESAGSRHWLVELDRVRFIDSTAIGLLIQIQRPLRRAGHRLVLVAPSLAVRRTLRLMRLEDCFHREPDVGAARAFLESLQVEPPPVSLNGGARSLCWRGEITAENVEQVRAQTRPLIAALSLRKNELKVDFSGVRFIDSAGVALMAEVQRHAQQLGSGLRFVAAPSEVREAVRQMKVDEALLADGS